MKNAKDELKELQKACQDLINFIYKKYNTRILTCEHLIKIDKLVNKEVI